MNLMTRSHLITALSLTLGLNLAASLGNAQSSNTSPASSVSTPAPSAASQSLLSNLVLGIKSTNTSARATDQNADKARIYKGKQEFQLGMKSASGWGAYGNLVQTRSEYNGSTSGKWSIGDHSLTVTHPDYYKDGTWRWSGYYRQYFPTSDFSYKVDQRQYAYYINTGIQLGGGAEIYNQLIPRYFFQSSYKPDQTKSYVEDRFVYNQKINNWSRWGLGAWTQYEIHDATSPGFTLEIIPQYDFVLNSKTFVGPRLYLPVAVKNAVFDGPKAATSEYALLEIYLQAAL